MKFINKTDSILIDNAIIEAEKLLGSSSGILKEILNKNDWKYSSGSGVEIVTKLMMSRPPIDVHYYKPLYPWSSAIGYYDGESIFVNYRKILDRKALVGLLLHEYAHYCGYTHANNYKSKDKVLFSVPYWLSENVHKYL